MMQNLLNLATGHGRFSFPGTILGLLWHTDWHRAHRHGGIAGVLREAGRSLLGLNAWEFYIPLNSGWNSQLVKQLLERQGIRMWGAGQTHGLLFFRIPERQAAAAQRMMNEIGIPVNAFPM